MNRFGLGGLAKHHSGDLEDECGVVVTMLSMASPFLNRCALGGVIRTYGGIPESVKEGIEDAMAPVLTTEEVVVAWKTMWNTASPCSNQRALGGVPESVRDDIEGDVGQVLTTKVVCAKAKANSTRLKSSKKKIA